MMKDGTQNYLVFQPLIKHFDVPESLIPIVISWKSKSNYEIIKPPTSTNNSVNPKLQ